MRKRMKLGEWAGLEERLREVVKSAAGYPSDEAIMAALGDLPRDEKRARAMEMVVSLKSEYRGRRAA